MNHVIGNLMLHRIALLLLMIFGLSGITKAQSEWTPLTDSSGVSISYQESVCNNKQVVLLKISNSNEQAVTINWSALNSGPAEAFIIQANASSTGSCNGNSSLIFTLIPGYDVASFLRSFRITSIN